MKIKVICLILLSIPIAISIYFLVVFLQQASFLIESINSFMENPEFYEEYIEMDRQALIRAIIQVCTCVVVIASCVAVAILIFKKDIAAINGNIVEQWRAYKQAKAERKAAKTAEQKQARIAELEQELNKLKDE